MSDTPPTKSLQVLIDDPDATAFTYGGGPEWDKGILPMWYGQTTVFPAFALDNLKNTANPAYGTLRFQFDGIAAAFVGNTPGAAWSQNATVSIDGGPPYNVTYPGTPPSYIQWYKTPTLPPGNHTVEITHLEGTALDYAIVDVGPQTNLTRRTVVVDDNDPDIQYYGSWSRNPSTFDAGYLPDGYPYGNGTHRTSNVGDRVTFGFSGSQLKVYGIFNWATVGVLAAEYTVDGVPSSQIYPVASDSPEHQRGTNDAANFLLFSTDIISPGHHTLVITITRAEGIAFALDFFTYTPAFPTLDQKPNVSSFVGSATSTTYAPGSGPTTVSNGTHTPIPAKDNTVVILGSVLGAVAAVALALLGILLWRQRRRQRRPSPSQLTNTYRETPWHPARGTTAQYTASSRDSPSANAFLAITGTNYPPTKHRRLSRSISYPGELSQLSSPHTPRSQWLSITGSTEVRTNSGLGSHGQEVLHPAPPAYDGPFAVDRTTA